MSAFTDPKNGETWICDDVMVSRDEPNIDELYGPLRGTEWLEMDHWAFQEFPREDYALFRKLADYHKVPLGRWLDNRANRIS